MSKRLAPPPTCCDGEPEARPFPPDLAAKARVFRALGDEVRLRLLHLVQAEEVCVCDLVGLMGMPQGTLSHHLSVLHQAGLVTARRQGRWNYYQATALAQGPLLSLAMAATADS